MLYSSKPALGTENDYFEASEIVDYSEAEYDYSEVDNYSKAEYDCRRLF